MTAPHLRHTFLIAIYSEKEIVKLAIAFPRKKNSICIQPDRFTIHEKTPFLQNEPFTASTGPHRIGVTQPA